MKQNKQKNSSFITIMTIFILSYLAILLFYTALTKTTKGFDLVIVSWTYQPLLYLAPPIITICLLSILISMRNNKDRSYLPVLLLFTISLISLIFVIKVGLDYLRRPDTKPAPGSTEFFDSINFDAYEPKYMTPGYSFKNSVELFSDLPENKKSDAQPDGIALHYSGDMKTLSVFQYSTKDRIPYSPCQLETPLDSPSYECVAMGEADGITVYRMKDLYGNGEDLAYYLTKDNVLIQIDPTEEIGFDEARKIIESLEKR